VVQFSTLGIMRYKYPAAVIGCLSQAAIVALLSRDIHSYLQGVVMWSLLVLWPFWTVFLWRYAQGVKVVVRVLATIIPFIFGWFILSPLLDTLV
jgi:hypothetical protein